MYAKLAAQCSGGKTIELQVVDHQSGSHGLINVLSLSAYATGHRVRFCNLGATLLKLYGWAFCFQLFVFIVLIPVGLDYDIILPQHKQTPLLRLLMQCNNLMMVFDLLPS